MEIWLVPWEQIVKIYTKIACLSSQRNTIPRKLHIAWVSTALWGALLPKAELWETTPHAPAREAPETADLFFVFDFPLGKCRNTFTAHTALCISFAGIQAADGIPKHAR
jgi:hypothetical protein